MQEEVSLPFPEILEPLRQLTRNKPSVYLVGGAVRDMLMRRPSHDLDIVMEGDNRPVARALADRLKADFFILDPERNTARVIYRPSGGGICDIDFATLNPEGIHADLAARDFTVNAMAVDLSMPHSIIDYLGGAADLMSRTLRACSPSAFADDPARLLRGVRLSQTLGFKIEGSSIREMKKNAGSIATVSAERIRDELFKILDNNFAAASIRVLEHLGILEKIFPELCSLKGVQQPAPHLLDAWEHTLAVLNELEWIFNLLIEKKPGKSADNWKMASAVIKLGKFKPNLQQHFAESITQNRSLRSLLFFAALFHDVGKPGNSSKGADGRIHFYNHEMASTSIVEKYSHAHALSQAETRRSSSITHGHMRIHSLVNAGILPSDRTIYRFFKAAGNAGVDLCLLSLADTLATYGVTLPENLWNLQLDICESLLAAWWEKKDQVIDPPILLNGTDIQSLFRLQAGPLIGDLLEALRESRAAGQIFTTEDAIIYSKSWLEQHDLRKERS